MPAEAIKAYAQETNRLNQERRAQSEQDRKALDKIERAIAGIMAAIEDGLYQPTMKARMEDLERQKAEIIQRLAQAPSDVPDLHPNIANLYRKRVEHFTQRLADHEDGRQAAEALRSLIGQIVLTPGEKRGEIHAELHGELFGILEFANPERNQRVGDVMMKAVAGPRNHSVARCAAPAYRHLPSPRAHQAYGKCLSLEVRQNGDQGSIQESRCDMVREDRDAPEAHFSRLAGSVGRIDGKAIANRNLGVLCKAPETLPREALHAHAVMSQKIGRRRSGQSPSHA